MPGNEHSAQRFQRLKVGNLKFSKGTPISTRGGPFWPSDDRERRWCVLRPQ